MTTASMRGFVRGITCSKCGDSLIAPERSEYLSKEQLVSNHWSCANCGNHFETEALISSVSSKAVSDRNSRMWVSAKYR